MVRLSRSLRRLDPQKIGRVNKLTDHHSRESVLIFSCNPAEHSRPDRPTLLYHRPIMYRHFLLFVLRNFSMSILFESTTSCLSYFQFCLGIFFSVVMAAAPVGDGDEWLSTVFECMRETLQRQKPLKLVDLILPETMLVELSASSRSRKRVELLSHNPCFVSHSIFV